MEQAASATNDHEVSHLLGSRDYVRAIDALAVAPVHPSHVSYKVRFHQLGRVPVHWIPQNDNASKDAVLADLSLTGPGGTDAWVLVPNPSKSTFERRPDPGFEITATPTVSDGKDFRIMLEAGMPFWEQLVPAVKIWGRDQYPDYDWSVAGASGAVSCFQTITAPGELHFALVRSRLGLFSIAVDFADRISGKLIVASFLRE